MVHGGAGVPEVLIKRAKALDFELKDDGAVVVQFARLGDPKRQQTKDIDKDRDVSLKGSIPVGKTIPMSAYAHRSWPERGGELPIGKGVLAEDGDKALFRGGFNLKTSGGRDTYEIVKDLGDIQEWSHGYSILDSTPGQWAGESAQIIKSFDIHEVSPVLIGAGQETATLAIKGAGLYDPDAEGASSLPFADHMARVLDQWTGFVKRAEAIEALRTKDGRDLGPSAKATIGDFLMGTENMESVLGQAADLRKRLREVLKDPAKGEAANEALALEAEFRALQTNLIGLGVQTTN
jgi:hypothetical protein